MTPSSARSGHVLVVDDEHDVADTQVFRLSGHYETSVAYSGEEALELAGPSVDAVLLDRRMPGIHGDDVLATLRDRGYDGVVVMLTAVDPDLNILDMAFDDYLRKPVDRETLLTTLDQHLDTPGADDRLEEYFEITSKMLVLESELPEQRLSADGEYTGLRERAEALESRLRAEMDDFEAVVETHRAIERGE